MGRRCKTDKLLLRWSEKEQDFVVFFPSSPDGSLILHTFCAKRHRPTWTGENSFESANTYPSLVKEFEKRGYDLKTIHFEITKRESNGNHDS